MSELYFLLGLHQTHNNDGFDHMEVSTLMFYDWNIKRFRETAIFYIGVAILILAVWGWWNYSGN